MKNVQQNKSNWIRFIVSIAFFAGIPVSLALLGWRFVDSHARERFIENQYRILEQNLYVIKREANEPDFINNLLNKLFGLLSEEKLDEKNILEIQKNVIPPDLNFISLFFFNSEGKLIELPNSPRENRGSLIRMFNALREYEVFGKADLMQKYRSLFVSFLGIQEPAHIYAEKGNLVRVILKGTPGFFYWNSFQRSVEVAPIQDQKKQHTSKNESDYFEGGIIAFFWEKDIPKNLGIRRTLQVKNRESKNEYFYGMINIDDPSQTLPQKFPSSQIGFSRSKMRNLIIKMREHFRQRLELPQGILAISPIDGGRVIFGFSSLSELRKRRTGLFIKILAAFIIVLVANLAWKIQISKSFQYISLRKKLIGLFLYATAVPITAFLLLGYQYVIDLKQVLIQRQFAALSNLNESIDQNFETAVLRLQNFFRKMAKSKAVIAIDREKLDRIASKLKHNKLPSVISVLSRTGKILYTSEKKNPNQKIFDKLLPTLARKFFFRHLAHDEVNVKDKISDVMVESFADSLTEYIVGTTSKTFFSDLLERINHLVEIPIGKVTNLIFSAFVYNHSKSYSEEDVKLLIVTLIKRRLTDVYLQKIVENRAKQSEEKKPIRLAYIENTRYEWIYPPIYSKYPFFREMFRKTVASQMQQTQVREMGGEPYLIVSSPLNRLSDYVLFSMFPQKIIDQKLNQIIIKVVIIGIVSGVFAFFVGFALSKHFLIPISELSTGITAIEKRNFGYRIPKLARDELGDLGIVLNRVIGSLEEMHLGRAIQETLFPDKKLVLGEYEIFGKTRTMSDLGGDYFDYFIVDNRYGVVLIGDVTGHGLPAAILMAMTKSAISIQPCDEIIHPSKVLNKLNDMIQKTLKKAKLITLLYILLDSQNHCLKIANAGHNYPYHFSAKMQKLQTIEQSSFPLGARKKIVFSEAVVTLEPEDALILFTDGFVEACNSEKEIMGESRAKKMFFEAISTKDNLVSITERIFADLDKFMSGEQAQDDVSLVLIRRTKSPTNEFHQA